MSLYSIKDIASSMDVSKSTIQRAIKAAAVSAAKTQGQKRFYDDAAVMAIKQKIEPRQTASAPIQEPRQTASAPIQEPRQTASAPIQTESLPRQTASAPIQTESLPHQTASNRVSTDSSIESVLKMLQEQLEIKDKQIAAYQEQLAAKDKQIEDYSARLKEAMILTQGQQLLAAADKIENQAEPVKEQSSRTERPLGRLIEKVKKLF